ncbi:MAG: GNAT family N-acetyltransferase [Chloroflexota bacterium]
MFEITVRECKQDDLPRLIEIWKEQTDIELQLDERLQSPYYYSTYGGGAYIGGAISASVNPDVNHTHVVVALKGEGIVGFLWLFLGGRVDTVPTQAIVREMAIDSHDGQGGVGTALLDRCMEILREHGITALTVTAPKHHAVQQAFWRAKGGRVIQETFYLPVKPSDDESDGS